MLIVILLSLVFLLFFSYLGYIKGSTFCFTYKCASRFEKKKNDIYIYKSISVYKNRCYIVFTERPGLTKMAYDWCHVFSFRVLPFVTVTRDARTSTIPSVGVW